MKTIKNLFKTFASKAMAIPVLAVLLVPVSSYADDTAALQALLKAGATSLPAGHTYTVSSNLDLTVSLNMNNDVINMTGPSGATLRLRNPNISLSNGTVIGTWTAAVAGNPSGVSGVGIYANGGTVTNMKISNFSGYGIVVGGPYTNPTVTYNTITQVGYIGFFYDPETATTGGIFSHNIIDRSMLPPSTVQQLGVGIRGSTSGTATSSGWVITYNTISMPVSPASSAAECMEVRTLTGATVSNNTLMNGSIGISAVRCSATAINNNKFSGSHDEAIEFANCTNSSSNTNTITSAIGDGILIDGSPASSNITINGDIITGTGGSPIHAYKGTTGVTITGCSLTVGANAKAINLQATNTVNITNTTFNASGTGSMAIMLDTCPGNLTMSGGTIANFTKCVIAISNTTAGVVTDNVVVKSVGLTNVAANKVSTYVANGGAVGTNISVNQ